MHPHTQDTTKPRHVPPRSPQFHGFPTHKPAPQQGKPSLIRSHTHQASPSFAHALPPLIDSAKRDNPGPGFFFTPHRSLNPNRNQNRRPLRRG